MSDWVAVEVAWLGYPFTAQRPRPGIVDPLIRAALVADLCLAGSLADAGDGLEVDTTPTGFAPADRLLQAVVADPSRSLGWWLLHAPVSLNDVAEVLVDLGRWSLHGLGKRYHEVDAAGRTLELRRIEEAVQFGMATAAESVTGALLELLPIRQSTVDAPLTYGDADWIMPDLLDALAQRKALIEAAARDAAFTQSASFIV